MIANRLAGAKSTFEGTPFGWLNFADSTIEPTTAQFYEGATSLKVVQTGAAGRCEARTRRVNVVPGEELTLQGRVRKGIGDGFVWRIDWQDQDGAYVSTNEGNEGADFTLTGGWDLVRARFAVPAGAYNAAPRPSLRSAVTGDHYFIDAVEFGTEVIIPDSTATPTLRAILEAVGARLATIPGLRVFTHVPDVLAPPAAIVQLPRSVQFDLTAGRGADTYNLGVLVVVGKVSDRASTANLAQYLDAEGPTSIKEALDGDLGGVVDSARVESYENVGSYPFAGVEYLGAEFQLEVVA
jgi:hypothetical protein